jgi:hypothetical protein
MVRPQLYHEKLASKSADFGLNRLVSTWIYTNRLLFPPVFWDVSLDLSYAANAVNLFKSKSALSAHHSLRNYYSTHVFSNETCWQNSLPLRST